MLSQGQSWGMTCDCVKRHSTLLLHATYSVRNHRLRVTSRFKATQVYQMCSTDKQAVIWDEIATAINYVIGSQRENI